MDQDKVKFYEDQPIRTAWDEEKEEWYFSIVDVATIEQLLRLVQSIPCSGIYNCK